MPIGKAISVKYNDMAQFFHYNKDKDFKDNIEELMKVYQMSPLSNADLQNIIGNGISQFSMSSAAHRFGSGRENRRHNRLAQEKIANSVVQLKRATSKMKNSDPLGRNMIFINIEDTDEATKANEEFAEHCNFIKSAAAIPDFDKTSQQWTETVKNVVTFQCDAIKRAREALGVNEPKDLAPLYTLSLEEMINRYDQLNRYLRMMCETDNMIREFGEDAFTKEQLAEIRPYRDLVFELASIFDARMEIISNPLYMQLNPDRMFDKAITSCDFYDILTQYNSEFPSVLGEKYNGDDPLAIGTHPLYRYFAALHLLNSQHGSSILARLSLKSPP